jgi:sarcosine oxidase subunit beta
MKSTADVVIIGGGIQGISLAYHLTRRGVSDVLLLEMDTLGSGSSGRSAAIIGLAFQTEECLPLTRLSYAAFMSFEDELGADSGYEPIGTLMLAGSRGAPEARQRHALLQQLGVESHVLGDDDILRLTPGLNLDDIELGLYCPNEGNVDPHSVMMAYAQQARRRGVEFFEGVRVIGLQLAGDRIVGVETTDGPIATGCVVNAAGFNAAKVAAWAGMDLPITNYKRHIFFTEPVALYARQIPFTYDAEVAWYIRREGPGLLIGMGTDPSDEEDPQVDWSFLDVIGDFTQHRAPPLVEAGIKGGWAGLRSLTPDDNPILGPAPHLPGYWNDCGWGGHGIMNAPAGGMLLAEWIVDGAPSTLDTAPYAVERFTAERPATGRPASIMALADRSAQPP